MRKLFTEAQRQALQEAVTVKKVIDHCLDSAAHAKAEAKKWEAKGGPKAKTKSARDAIAGRRPQLRRGPRGGDGLPRRGRHAEGAAVKTRVFTESQRALLIEAAESPEGWYLAVPKGNHTIYYGPFKTHLQGLVYQAASMPAAEAKGSKGMELFAYKGHVYPYDKGELSGGIEMMAQGETGEIKPISKLKVHPSWAKEQQGVLASKSPRHAAAKVALYYNHAHGQSKHIPSDADIEKAIKGRL